MPSVTTSRAGSTGQFQSPKSNARELPQGTRRDNEPSPAAVTFSSATPLQRLSSTRSEARPITTRPSRGRPSSVSTTAGKRQLSLVDSPLGETSVESPLPEAKGGLSPRPQPSRSTKTRRNKERRRRHMSPRSTFRRRKAHETGNNRPPSSARTPPDHALTDQICSATFRAPVPK